LGEDRKERERSVVRKSGCWICGVTEEGEILCGKTVAAMYVFTNVYRQIICEQIIVMECCTYTCEMCEMFSVINMFINVKNILTNFFWTGQNIWRLIYKSSSARINNM
jgi:hypothetical protein